MKKLLALLLAALVMAGCTKKDTSVKATETTGSTNATVSVADPEDMYSDRDYETDYTDDRYGTIRFNGSTITANTNAVNISSTKAEITEEGTYVLTGNLNDGQVVVNAEKTDKIQLVLSGAQINSATSAPIYVKQADKVFITAEAGTENTLSNGGSYVAIDDNNIDAVIFSKDDLTLNGEGSLTITAPAGNGVASKDALVITGGKYAITTSGHGLEGKDSVRIDGGDFALTTGKDGIHAENNDDAASGFGYISGGTFAITAEGDGISAAAKLEITAGTFTITAGGGSVNGDKANSGNYGGFGGGPGGGPGGRPGRGGSVEMTASTTEADSASMKALKASGNLTVTGGTFTIDSADDALHSNGDLSVAGGMFTIATGDDGFHADENLNVSAGTIAVSKSYEGFEGHYITVSGGEISLTASDDGLNAAGGTDGSGGGGRDQMFGGPGGMSSGNGSIVISGGNLYIQVSGDGIDANGTLEITGGYTVVCGPTQGDTATLDYDKTGVIKGGTFIGTGAAGMAQSFSSSENQGVIAVRANGTANTQITVTDSTGKVLISYAPKLDFNVVILSSPDLKKGSTYTLTVGAQTKDFQAS